MEDIDLVICIGIKIYNSMRKHKVYILQMYSQTIPSKLIKFFTHYKYSHIAISFDKNCNVICSFGRTKYNSILNGGFVKENKNGEFFNYYNDTLCKIYELNITKKQYYRLKNIILNMDKNSYKYKYDYIGIVLRFFKIPITFKYKYVCSYFVADMLFKSNIYNFNKSSYFVFPKDFENIKNTRIIYDGIYKLYN